MTPNQQSDLIESQTLWDNAAATFDCEADHGLGDPETRQAWQRLLLQLLPPPPAMILDLGCGTGSLSLLMAEEGYQVSGGDFSEQMLIQARAKATHNGQRIDFHLMDVANPQLGEHKFSVVLCRHVLWALPEPEVVLQRWAKLLLPGGKLVLIEGFWMTGAGLPANTLVAMLPPPFTVEVVNLSEQSVLWGHAVNDERYVVVAY